MTAPGGTAAPALGGTAAPPAVWARGVRRSFGPVLAVSGIDLDAPFGQVTALVGPNGAGKTTLMLVLATLLKPDSGEVRVAGFDPVVQAGEVR
ncbi:MAG TPA: ATP-binding cassette domain-containing protein, partial [Mycobacteriales bacterium]